MADTSQSARVDQVDLAYQSSQRHAEFETKHSQEEPRRLAEPRSAETGLRPVTKREARVGGTPDGRLLTFSAFSAISARDPYGIGARSPRE